jgi:hypothetical protein
MKKAGTSKKCRFVAEPGLVPEISEKVEIKRYDMGLPVGQGLDRRRIDDKLVPLAGIQHAQRQGNAQANIGCVGEIAIVDICIVPQVQIEQ